MIQIDNATFQRLLNTVGATKLDPREIPAVIQLVEIAAAVDLDDDRAERTLLRALTPRLCALGRISEEAILPLSRVPTDHEERAAHLAALAARIITPEARELAFALAYLVAVADLELSPVEGTMIAQLQRTLAISDDRGDELAAAAAEIVTPGSTAMAATDDRHATL